ncbi:type III-B CRISPR module RAMP protein Cmr6 [Truepera radiovictrix]|uniref:CRISPR-associated RAMP protein, Cmr6 family n=1 Tax=Truepera radiovictrix (strain DSM 17093 / CIP 108686 / LMG 22925 / RQ-24) TaxID=649638 RepID=D7CYE7_TRURR|nr:type III-B CRISPR module RAMP protein Cmr6 [Truepera radiovictrix]ADI14786.1 CRISPR-associated RAMP protein, Cmr6 family [Truepera radiovictrix DSM 17093]WMT56663.1 type III-B CRISPR module RAMP protein Cmr6 [Truepera radiovictrix]
MRRLAGFPLKGASHAGHAIHRLLPQKERGGEDAQKERLKTIVALPISDAYAIAFKLWQEQLEEHAANVAEAEKALNEPVPEEQRTACVKLSATTRGPLAIGLGNPSPYEVGLTLHHTYGVPYLPGTALKGLARRAALKQGMSEADAAFRVLFGDTKSAGYVTFWDGWLDAGCEKPLQLDTITVHHPEYYQGGKAWPTDFDDPNPVAFLSVRVGVRFQLRLTGPGEWVTLAAQLLEWGLTHLGLGGKTNAGYGDFEVRREKSEAELAAEKRREEEARVLRAHQDRFETYQGRINRLRMNNPMGEVSNIVNETQNLPEPLRRQLLEALLEKLESDSRTRNSGKLLKKVRDALEALS